MLLALFTGYTRNNIQNEDLHFVWACLACFLPFNDLSEVAQIARLRRLPGKDRDCRAKASIFDRGKAPPFLMHGQYKHLIAAVYLFYSPIYNVMYININV